MAITVTGLVGNGNTTDLSSYSTASITPSADVLVLAAITSWTTSGTGPGQPTLSGNGLTWTNHQTNLWDDAGVARVRTTLFRATGSSPSSGAVTIDFSGTSQSHCQWSICEVSGVPITGTSAADAIVQTQIASETVLEKSSASLQMSAFENVANGIWACASWNTGTPGPSSLSARGALTQIHSTIYTEGSDAGGTTTGYQTSICLNPTFDCRGDTGLWGMIAVELRNADLDASAAWWTA